MNVLQLRFYPTRVRSAIDSFNELVIKILLLISLFKYYSMLALREIEIFYVSSIVCAANYDILLINYTV